MSVCYVGVLMRAAKAPDPGSLELRAENLRSPPAALRIPPAHTPRCLFNITVSAEVYNKPPTRSFKKT